MILILTPDINFEFKYEFLILEFRYGLLIQFKYALLIKSISGLLIQFKINFMVQLKYGLLIWFKNVLHGIIEILTPDKI